MPAVSVSDAELPQLIAFVRTLRPRGGFQPYRKSFAMTNGRSLDGLVVNEGSEDAQFAPTTTGSTCCGGRTRANSAKSRPRSDWPSYNGDLGGNRYTTLRQIDKSNVKRVAPKWIFRIPNAGRLQGTPVVADGVMYVTQANECYALDAGNGRQIWRYQRPRSTGLAGDAASGINRGVALGGDKLFMVTDNAHLIALNRATGLLVWDIEMADWRQNHGATSAPLAVGNLVISGTGGGDNGAQGFVAAFDQATGKEVWRFSTLPKPGEPAWDTWKGTSIEHGGAQHLVHRHVRSGNRHAVLADGQSRTGLQRRRARRRQPVFRLHPRARSSHRQAEVVLPVHSARPLGLGRHRDADGDQRQLGRPAPHAAGAGEPQRVLLRLRSRRTESCCSPNSSSRT